MISRHVTREPGVRYGPGRVFHVQLGLAIVVLLIAVSHPGLDGFLWLLGALWLLGLAIVWAFTGIRYLRARQRRDRRSGRLFVVAPLVLLITFSVVKVDLPLRVRWELSKPRFDAVVAGPLEGITAAGDRERIGLFTITHVDRRGDAILFYEEAARPYGYAGFAYLPSGPSKELELLNEATWFYEFDGEWFIFFASP